MHFMGRQTSGSFKSKDIGKFYGNHREQCQEHINMYKLGYYAAPEETSTIWYVKSFHSKFHRRSRVEMDFGK